jgi:hypothetical protein
LVGIWNVTMHLTAVSGAGCVAETMRSHVGAPRAYSLSITPKGNGIDVTLSSASGDYRCTFTNGSADATGFSFGPHARYSCTSFFYEFQCADGTRHSIFTFGENLFGGVSGTDIEGFWDATWFDGMDDHVGVETRSEFTGRR